MKILIDDLTSAPLRIRRSVPSAEFGGEMALFEKVELDIVLVKSGRKVKISGSVGASAELRCSRCLEVFDFTVDAEHILEYIPAIEAEEEEKIRLKKDELSVIYYNEPVINLYEDVRQTIILSFPIKPICSPDCRGLCASCGAALNLEECRCEEKPGDPRFECLRKLLKERKK